MNIAIIPARGGSKRIPKKNIRLFRGKPMIAWSIEAAIESNCFDKVFVSTDSEEIASIAKSLGAWVPFLRPNNISDDYSTTKDVIEYCIQWFKEKNIVVNYVCCLYATAPFVRADDLKKGLNLINQQTENRFIFSATNFSFPIQRAIKINEEGISSMFYPENFNVRSQDLENAYHDAGQFYFAKPNVWINKENLFEDALPILIPNWRVQDIDEEDDWARAEMLHEILEKKNERKEQTKI